MQGALTEAHEMFDVKVFFLTFYCIKCFNVELFRDFFFVISFINFNHVNCFIIVNM